MNGKQAGEPPANGNIEIARDPDAHGAGETDLKVKPGDMKTVAVGMAMPFGQVRVEKGDGDTWELVIGILSAGLELAKFQRNMIHGQAMQEQAMNRLQEEAIKQELAKKGKIHV